ncbi:MAG: dimethyladenosine transferase, rRNA (adenine1518-N6/adenine1519-N6)-dimethyltransferase, partial [Candidatus Parcubacteria bacterium]
RFFSPAPKVDSAIIAITVISKDNFTDKDQENRFFEILRAGFAHKRKVLKKNLEDVLSKEKIAELFKEYNINEKVRAEDIKLQNWLDFTK